MSDSKIRVAFLATDLCFDGGGGAERVMAHVLNGLDHDKYDVTVISMLPFDEEQVCFRIPDTHVYSLNMKRGKASIRDVSLFREVIGHFDPHVVYCWMHHAILLGRVSAFLEARKHAVVSSFRSERSPGSTAVRTGLKLSRWVDTVSVAVSTRVAKQVCREGLAVQSRIRVIPNGVDTSKFRPVAEKRDLVRRQLGIPGDTFLFTALGRLEEAKGYGILLKSFAEVITVIPSARLVIAGEGSERHTLEMQINSLGLENTVKLLGHVDDPGHILAASDCHVLPSLWEGMPNSMLEAMSCGVLCVASDVGGVRDVITDGQTGYVVPPGRDHYLARVLVDVATASASHRKGMGIRARQHILDAFSIESLVAANECLLQECYEIACRRA